MGEESDQSTNHCNNSSSNACDRPRAEVAAGAHARVALQPVPVAARLAHVVCPACGAPSNVARHTPVPAAGERLSPVAGRALGSGHASSSCRRLARLAALDPDVCIITYCCAEGVPAPQHGLLLISCPRYLEVPAVGYSSAYATWSGGAHEAAGSSLGIVAAPHVEEVVCSTLGADTLITGITTLFTTINTYAINGELSRLSAIGAIMLHIPITIHHDRPARPHGTPAGRVVLAELRARKGPDAIFLIVRLALGARGSGAIVALSASLDSLVIRVIAGEALAGPVASFHEVPLLAG